jgi:hypothetical protein
LSWKYASVHDLICVQVLEQLQVKDVVAFVEVGRIYTCVGFGLGVGVFVGKGVGLGVGVKVGAVVMVGVAVAISTKFTLFSCFVDPADTP